MYATRVRRGAAAMSLLVTLASASACSDSKSTAPDVPAVMSIVHGSGQALTVGSDTSDSLTIMLTTAGADPARHIAVTWTMVQGDGTLSEATSTTDDNGQTTILYHAGHTASVVKVQAKVTSVDPVEFDITQTADTPHAAAETPDEPVTTVLGSGSVELSVRILDEFGNPVPGATVTWTVSGGDGKDSFDLAVSATDDQGIAFVQFTPRDVAGSRTITAQTAQGIEVDIPLTVQSANIVSGIVSR